MSEFSISTYQTPQFSPDKIALIKRTIADGASDDELALFIYQCQRTGLDPFARQIYSIQRQVYDPKLNRKVSKMTVQVSIDGLRLIAERTGKYAGQVGPFWCGTQSDLKSHDSVGNQGVQWLDVWTSKEYPAAAKVGVIRSDFKEPLYSIALWSEYAPIFDGKVSPMWAKFPAHQLAKCAEALSLRRAFPQDLSDLYTPEEMSQAESVPSPNPKKVLTIDPEKITPAPKPEPAPSDDDRPYPPMVLKAKLAEAAPKLIPATSEQVTSLTRYLQTYFMTEEELLPMFYRFIFDVPSIEKASLRAVAAVCRWLGFGRSLEESSTRLSQRELEKVVDFLRSSRE